MVPASSDDNRRPDESVGMASGGRSSDYESRDSRRREREDRNRQERPSKRHSSREEASHSSRKHSKHHDRESTDEKRRRDARPDKRSRGSSDQRTPKNPEAPVDPVMGSESEEQDMMKLMGFASFDSTKVIW